LRRRRRAVAAQELGAAGGEGAVRLARLEKSHTAGKFGIARQNGGEMLFLEFNGRQIDEREKERDLRPRDHQDVDRAGHAKEIDERLGKLESSALIDAVRA